MRHMLRCALAMATILLVCALSPGFPEGDKKEDEQVNPLYRDWVSFPLGTKLIVHETTVLGGEGGTDEKTVEYELKVANPKRAIVRTLVVERELLSEIESAPTRIIYPAKVSKAALQAASVELDAKRGTATMKFMGKDLEVKTLELTKKNKNEVVKTRIWRSTSVPGGVVKQIRTTEQDGKLIATTTTTVVTFKLPEKKGKKDKEKPKTEEE